MQHTDPSTIFQADSHTFESTVLERSHEHPVLVDFWADWCPPCKALEPHLERLIREYQGTLLLAKVEVDEGDNMKLAGHYRLHGFPTVILFRDGSELGRFSGARSTTQLRTWICEHLEQADCDD